MTKTRTGIATIATRSARRIYKEFERFAFIMTSLPGPRSPGACEIEAENNSSAVKNQGCFLH
jgi:hypothetical protein